MIGHSPSCRTEQTPDRSVIELSNSESRTLCKRVFSALQYPAGSDTEIADSFVWLAAMELVPLSYLAESLSVLHYSPIGQIDDPSVTADELLSNQHNLLSLIDTIDTLTAQTVQERQPGTATIAASSFAMLLLPLIVMRSRVNLIYQLDLLSSPVLARNGSLWSREHISGLRSCSNPRTGTLVCALNDGNAEQLDLRQNEMDFHMNRSEIDTTSSGRVTIDLDSYAILKQKAAESFVPNSEYSRTSGAGANTSDNV